MVEIKINTRIPKEDRIALYKHLLNIFLVIFVVFIIFIFVKQWLSCEPEVIEKECPECELSCDECPEKIKENIIYRNVTNEIVKYVCEDGTTVDQVQDCIEEEVELPELKPILTNENGTLIKHVTVAPACIGGYRGGYISYEVKSPAQNASFQIKEEGATYQDILKTKGFYKAYKEFVICDPDCPRKGDFSLEYNKRYLFRMEFDRTVIYGRTEYSNEHVIDLTPNSNYMTKTC